MDADDEYLWNREGAPDPEIARLETLLSEYRYQPARPAVNRRRWRWWAMAAGVAIAMILGGAVWRVQHGHRGEVSVWEVAGRRLTVGQTVETSGQQSMTLEAQQFGEVELAPNSVLEVLAAGRPEEQKLSLRRGMLHAFIWAPPASFVVETPSAKTVDLGCSYTLSVQADGAGELTVQTGWVAFQHGATESFIPAGAVCHTRAKSGPGVPYFATAAPALQAAVREFDASGGRAGLTGILQHARPEDGLTLWHLLARTSGADRARVAQAFAQAVPGAKNEEAALAAGDPAAVDRAWNRLDLGGTDWWRTWKQNWRR